MRKTEIVIIGGGAAGLMASCAAARILKKPGAVLVLEGNPKLGRKLLATGNGRCNLTNLNVSPEHYHGDVKQILPLLGKYTPEAVIAEFRRMGLVTRPDGEGRVYPRSQQAASVLAVLRAYAEKNGAESRIEAKAEEIRRTKHGFLVKCADGGEIEAKKCILASGGAAAKHSCGEGYSLAETLGHSVTKLYPALTQLLSKNKSLRSVSGMRCGARAALLADGKELYAESGEVQFTDAGLSGICIFGLSVYAAEFFAFGKIGGKPCKSLAVELDCMPDWAFPELADYLLEIKSAFPERPAGDLLLGALNMRIGYALVQAAGIDPNAPAKTVGAGQLKKLASLVKAWRFELTGTKGLPDAQVTAGGVPLAEIDVHTMRSKKTEGLYLAGELLNIHGDCGGYNLHFAWATGIAAGTDAAESLIKEKKA